ncbi:MAG TPA: hypothetical protein VFG69_18850 [Nannocystaceae bacterium]|nr:hypothetical protein [Nannocystaceae bacterium]
MFAHEDARAQSAPVVRRCSKCEQAAVVLVHDWKHSVGSTTTGWSTKDYRCQSCGKKYRVRPRMQTILGLCVGVMAATTIIGIPLFVLYWRRHTVPSRILPVPGAPMPPMRFADGPPQRSCGGCAAPASVYNVTRHTHNGVPTGTEYKYRCAACNREFTVQSVWGIVFGTLVTLLAAAAAWGFYALAETPGWRWGGAGVCAAIVLLLFGQIIAQVRTRTGHPVVESALLP